MDVILLERVEKLGRIGDVVTVKTGYARNFLLPRGKALRATEANRKRFEAQRTHLEAENAKRREVAEVEAKAIEGITFILIRQASNAGALYGSVSARDLAEALGETGHKVAKSAIVLDRPIKALGLHAVKVALHPEVAVMVTANVARSPEEAELQAKGVDVTAMSDAEEAPEAESPDVPLEAAAEEA
jgi:large subunit ribosomal protein L9